MKAIDGLDSTPDGRFQDGNPAAGILGTVLTAKCLNQIQEEWASFVERAGITLDDADDGQIAQAAQAIYGSGVAGGSLKNALLNGGFSIWQRGLSRAVTNALTYTADRWAARADAEGSGSGTATFTRQAFAPGQTDVPGAAYFLRWNQTAVATAGAPAMFQRVERLERFSSGKISVSFYARVAAATLNGSVRVFQAFGAGGSTEVQVANQVFTATTTWTRFAFTFDLPSMTGMTAGTNPNLRVGLTLAVNATWTLEIADYQAELADQASAFDRRPLGLELLLCGRYFQKSYALDVTPGTDGGVPADARAGAVYGLEVELGEGTTGPGVGFWYEHQTRLMVPMRATPTVVWFKPGTGATANALTISASGPVDSTVDTNQNASERATGYPHTTTPSGGSFGGYHAAGHWTADAEI